MASSYLGRRIWIALALSIAPAGTVHAQAVPRPRPSTVWQHPAANQSTDLATLKGRDLSPKTRGLLIGAIIGGVAAGFLGNRLCHEIGSGGNDGCGGDTLWYAVAGGLLGGLIGATGARND